VLVRERRIAQGMAPGTEKQIAQTITPVELLLSFSPTDQRGEPRSEPCTAGAVEVP